MTRCRNCKYWNSGLDVVGECRRYAPRKLYGTGTGYDSEQFPETQAGDWCGEFAPIESKAAPAFDAEKIRKIVDEICGVSYQIGHHAYDIIQGAEFDNLIGRRNSAIRLLYTVLGIDK